MSAPYTPEQALANLRESILPALPKGDPCDTGHARWVCNDILARGIAEPGAPVESTRPPVATSHDAVARARESLRVAELDLRTAAAQASGENERLLHLSLSDLIGPVSAAASRLSLTAGLLGEEAK